MWKCLNDLFAYCAGEPQRDSISKPLYYTGIDGRKHKYEGMEPHCKRDLHSCTHYRTVYQVYPKDKLKQLVKT